MMKNNNKNAKKYMKAASNIFIMNSSKIEKIETKMVAVLYYT